MCEIDSVLQQELFIVQVVEVNLWHFSLTCRSFDITLMGKLRVELEFTITFVKIESWTSVTDTLKDQKWGIIKAQKMFQQTKFFKISTP